MTMVAMSWYPGSWVRRSTSHRISPPLGCAPLGLVTLHKSRHRESRHRESGAHSHKNQLCLSFQKASLTQSSHLVRLETTGDSPRADVRGLDCDRSTPLSGSVGVTLSPRTMVSGRVANRSGPELRRRGGAAGGGDVSPPPPRSEPGDRADLHQQTPVLFHVFVTHRSVWARVCPAFELLS